MTQICFRLPDSLRLSLDARAELLFCRWAVPVRYRCGWVSCGLAADQDPRLIGQPIGSGARAGCLGRRKRALRVSSGSTFGRPFPDPHDRRRALSAAPSTSARLLSESARRPTGKVTRDLRPVEGTALLTFAHGGDLGFPSQVDVLRLGDEACRLRPCRAGAGDELRQERPGCRRNISSDGVRLKY